MSKTYRDSFATLNRMFRYPKHMSRYKRVSDIKDSMKENNLILKKHNRISSEKSRVPNSYDDICVSAVSELSPDYYDYLEDDYYENSV